MNIVIDARVLIRGRTTGVEEYARFLIQNILDRDTANHYEFFYSGFRKLPFPEAWRRRNTSVRSIDIPNKILEASMRLFHVPRADRETTDIVYSPHFNILPAPLHAKRIVTFHDLSFVHFPEFYSLRKRFFHWQQAYRAHAARADALIAISEFTRRDLITTLGVSEERVHTIYPGINPFYEHRRPHDEDMVRVGRDPRLAQPFILFVGTVEPRKNISGIIKAFDIIKQNPRHRDLRLIIAGNNGWLYATILRDAAHAQWAKDILFWGAASHEELRVLFNRAEVFVYPSFFEGFGLPPLEAQVCGTPVIASNRSSLPEVLGESALLVDPWSHEELVHALHLVLTKEPLRKDLIARGYENSKRFSWERASTELLHLFHTQENHAATRTKKEH